MIWFRGVRTGNASEDSKKSFPKHTFMTRVRKKQVCQLGRLEHRFFLTPDVNELQILLMSGALHETNEYTFP